jgi:hypothetical protein
LGEFFHKIKINIYTLYTKEYICIHFECK